MKIKIRGEKFAQVNKILDGEDVDIFIGEDADGREVYTGDIVTDTQNGGKYRANLVLDLDFLPFESCISNFKLEVKCPHCGAKL